jgi:nucleotide-binding universal stress UspA family protein/hemerythrin-like domain-containing protein
VQLRSEQQIEAAMYQHLLVPVEDSSLSAANVTSAIRLAKALGARITFFHATRDFAATGEGALLRSIEPAQFEAGQIGERHSILSKVGIAARIAGVESIGVAGSSDRPAEAIVAAAIAQGCDLIVMASRGARGVAAWMNGSQTQRVLKQSPIALLVTRVEANEPLRASERVLAVIQDEHRSLAVVLAAMQKVVKQATPAAGAGPLPDHDVIALKAMIGYVRDFPQRLHHPKEEQYLHPPLRLRHPEADTLLLELEAQHRREAERVAAVEAALAGGDTASPARMSSTAQLVDAIDQLAVAVIEHMGLEERTVLPMALEHLLEEDWQAAAAAFSGHRSPQFSDLATEDLHQLFVRISGWAADAAQSAPR